MQFPGFLREKEKFALNVHILSEKGITKIKFDDLWKNMLFYKVYVFSRN